MVSGVLGLRAGASESGLVVSEGFRAWGGVRVLGRFGFFCLFLFFGGGGGGGLGCWGGLGV